MIKKHIPNAITCLNLICGCVSILFLCHNRLLWASGMIFVAAVFDFLDGFAARLLDAKSPIGVELDSLADIVSFGVAPSFIVAWYLSRTGVCWWVYNFNVFSVFAFVLAAFAAIRLAKFNLDTRQTESFRGLPVPAVGLFIASLPFMLFNIEYKCTLYNFVVSPYFLMAMVVIFSWLMVSNIPFFSFKFNTLRLDRDNILRYLVIIFAIASLIILKLAALPFIILFYILLSLVSFRGK